MTQTFYSIDRTPSLPRAELRAWHVREARDNFVAEDPDHREKVTADEAKRVCRQWHSMSLGMAMAKGLV